MLVQTDTTFKDLSTGKKMLAEKDVELTMRVVLINALMVETEKDKDATGVQKILRYKIATKISESNGSVELTVSEAKECLDRVDRVYPPLIVGPVHELLDPQTD